MQDVLQDLHGIYKHTMWIVATYYNMHASPSFDLPTTAQLKRARKGKAWNRGYIYSSQISRRVPQCANKHHPFDEYRWSPSFPLLLTDHVACVFVINELPPALRYIYYNIIALKVRLMLIIRIIIIIIIILHIRIIIIMLQFI